MSDRWKDSDELRILLVDFFKNNPLKTFTIKEVEEKTDFAKKYFDRLSMNGRIKWSQSAMKRSGLEGRLKALSKEGLIKEVCENETICYRWRVI